MGLLDVLNGMQNGPRGQTNPNAQGTQGGGMSPITMAILALLAYKGIKHMSGGQQQPAPGGTPQRVPGNNPINTGAPAAGGLGDILGGLLGGNSASGAPAGGGGLGGALGGDLGGLLKGGLGGLLAGGAAGSVLSGGLGGLLKQFEDNGQAQVAKSWVGTGPNQDISESDLAKSIGTNDINALAQHTGLSRDELLAGLRRELPGAIDELTPNGRVPSPQELSQRV
jgi:uncharacterized protein YidB (DUF937 family)